MNVSVSLVILLRDGVGSPGVDVAVLPEPAGGHLLTLQPHLQVVRTLRRSEVAKVLHHLHDGASHAGVLGEGHGSCEAVVETDKGLFEVERSVVPVEELRNVLERDEEVNGFPVLD